MRLGDADDVVLELRIVGYEFSREQLAPGVDEWDANWLLVAGRVRLADGTTWSFRDPALVTSEAGDLLDWLQDDARLTAPETIEVLGAEDEEWPWEADATRRHWLAFTEPNLAFATAMSGGELCLLVGLALECAAPGQADSDGGKAAWSLVQVPWSASAAERAAGEWSVQLQAHPSRDR